MGVRDFRLPDDGDEVVLTLHLSPALYERLRAAHGKVAPEVEFIDRGRVPGAKDLFTGFLDWLNKQVSKVIVGQTSSAEGLECMWSPLVAAPRLVFLSSVLFYGDLSVHAPSLGDYSLSDFPDGGKTGVLLADARCQALAELGGLTEDGAPPFPAWLSDNNGTELSSVVDGLHPNAPP